MKKLVIFVVGLFISVSAFTETNGGFVINVATGELVELSFYANSRESLINEANTFIDDFLTGQSERITNRAYILRIDQSRDNSIIEAIHADILEFDRPDIRTDYSMYIFLYNEYLFLSIEFLQVFRLYRFSHGTANENIVATILLRDTFN